MRRPTVFDMAATLFPIAEAEYGALRSVDPKVCGVCFNLGWLTFGIAVSEWSLAHEDLTPDERATVSTRVTAARLHRAAHAHGQKAPVPS